MGRDLYTGIYSQLTKLCSKVSEECLKFNNILNKYFF